MDGSTRAPTTDGHRPWAAVFAVAIIAALTLVPRAVIAPAHTAFLRAVESALGPLSTRIDSSDVEGLLNAALFAPIGFVIALLLRPRAWPVALIAGLAVSVAVEVAQGVIPGRVTDRVDVVWNTLGATAGALVVVSGRLLRRRPAHRGQG